MENPVTVRKPERSKALVINSLESKCSLSSVTKVKLYSTGNGGY